MTFGARALVISQRHVHAADEADATVNDDNLTVVAVVDLAGERRESHGQEGHHLDALFAHALEEAVLHVPAADIVVDESYLDTLACLVDEHVAQQHAQWVVLNDVQVNVDVLACLADGLEKCGEELTAVA